LATTAKRALSLIVAFALGIGAFTFAKNLGWLSPFGIKSESSDSQIIQSIERTQEVSLLALGIQGIKQTDRCAEAFGKCIPGTGESVFLQYNFTGKLGLDGSAIEVTKTGDSAYSISVPEFGFIGYDEPTFKTAVEEGGILGWVTPDVDKAEMITEILNDDAQEKYVDDHEQLLREQTELFYDNLIASIVEDAETSYTFS
jgi:hypothetical protein